jgi:hypothetical protein
MKLPSKKQINWKTPFLDEVKNKGAKNQECLEAIQSQDKEDKEIEST